MAEELMTKVKELLELGGVDEDTVKAVTEKLISEKGKYYQLYTGAFELE